MGDFKHKHSLGQNFLKDKSVLTKIIDSVDVKEDDLIIEVGPGQGALTKYLKLYKKDVFELSKMLIDDVYNTYGITATVGVGTNLFLAKVALDISAKHISSNKQE